MLIIAINAEFAEFVEKNKSIFLKPLEPEAGAFRIFHSQTGVCEREWFLMLVQSKCIEGVVDWEIAKMNLMKKFELRVFINVFYSCLLLVKNRF